MGYFFEEELLMLIPGLLSGIPTGLFGIAAYILTALAIYTVSRRRGLNHPWLAWIPVVNCWLLGSISDQYQYVVKGETKSKRKWLLVLNILQAALVSMLTVLAVVTVGTLIVSQHSDVMGAVVAVLALAMPLAAVAIAQCVIRYIALFDVYRCMDPANAVLYLVLSIVVSITMPFFIFACRNSDEGMPPKIRNTVNS